MPDADVQPPGAESVSVVVSEDVAQHAEAAREVIARTAKQKLVPHPSLEEREQRGRLARAQIPRERMADWGPAVDREDPVALLLGQEESRVQELVPVRHARMSTSAFAFYRGAALLMAADLATMPHSGLTVQLCGDAHLANFGLFAAPDRSVIFDVNDFDETHPGPFEWDVKRLGTSFVLAASDNGMPKKSGLLAAETVARSYRESMAQFATMRELEIWYDRIDVSGLIDTLGKLRASRKDSRVKQAARAKAAIEGAAAKARMRDAWSAIEKITEVVDGTHRFRNQPPLLARVEVSHDVRSAIEGLFREYRSTLQDDRQELLKRYEIIDMGHKVVGVGSVGLLAFVLLLRGRDENDLMVLQVKQAQSSVLEAFTHKSAFTKHGHRVVTGQRLMQAASDSFLGWIDGPMGRSFYVRQLRDMKWSPDPSQLVGDRLAAYAALCGHTLARAHARSGDAVALTAYMGTGRAFDRAVTQFSGTYALQAEQDYAAFMAAVADGRMTAHEDGGGAEGLQAAHHFAESAKPKRATKQSTAKATSKAASKPASKRETPKGT